MVNATKALIVSKGEPESHSEVPSVTCLNCSNCDIKIITANPFTNPNITGCGTNRMNLPNLNNPTII